MKRIYSTVLFLIIANHEFAQISQGYTDKLSYRAGEAVKFYLDAGCQLGCTLDLCLQDIAGNNLYSLGNIDIPSSQSITNSDAWANGYGYARSLTTWGSFPTTSGYYMIDDVNNPNINTRIPIIIKGDNTTADIVIVCETNTINAYTSSGGKSLYVYNSSNLIPATTVSFHRPQSRVQYSKCSDGFLDWIRIWAANHNPVYTLNFISDMDMDNWNEIKDAKLLIIPGHSEYWTRQARLNFDQFVDEGKDALILSGNTMWMQVRYESNNGNPQLICHRGVNWDRVAPPHYYDEDPIANISDPNYHPLQATYPWSERDLKYSTIGSIGSDSWRGGYGDASYSSGGHKILVEHTDSPILSATNLHIGNSIPMSTAGNEEFDGTFVKADENGNALLVNGDPELDISALGFFRAEMLGYHLTSSTGYLPIDPNPNNSHLAYCPFMVFKKTKTSGTIINVNSNRWCTNNNNEWTLNPSTNLRPKITETMITLMMDDQNQGLNGDNLFQPNSIPPNSISLMPAYSNVSYVACLDGFIDITPDGIYLNNAYKIDNGFISNPVHVDDQGVIQPVVIDEGNNSMTAAIDNDCATYQPLKIGNHLISNNENNNFEKIDDMAFSLFPNPSTGKFTLKMISESNSEKNIYIFNSINQEIFHIEKTSDENMDIDLSYVSNGIYFVKVVVGDRTGIKKIVLM